MSFVGILSGVAEAGVLSLIAGISGDMVATSDRLHADLGLVSLQASVGEALIIAFLLSIVRLVLQAVGAWLPARLAANILTALRERLFTSFAQASWDVQSHEREGHMQEMMSNQTNMAAGAVFALSGLISSASMFTAMVATALMLSVPVALIVLATASLLIFALRPLGSWGGRAARDLSRASMNQSTGVNEFVRMAEEVNVFGAHQAIRTRVSSLIGAVSSYYYGLQFSLKINQTIYQGLVFILIVAGLAGLHASGDQHLTTLGAVILILVRAGTYSQQIEGNLVGTKQALPYLDRVDEACERYLASAPQVGNESLGQVQSLELRRVRYHYRDSEAGLHGVSLSVSAGDRIGIVGPSGAGKSTLVQILLRLRSPDEGRYEVNGRPADSYRPDSWQRHVSYLPQDPQLLRASVADNIRFFRPLSDDEVKRAARAAHIYDEIMAMPQGFDTVISQRGEAVSGGQRQRICLARALATHPDVLVLDEPTSALDMNSEAAVHESLAALPANVILFIVAHRLSTLKICDRVLVLQNGQVDAFGDRAELARSNDFFRQATALAGAVHPPV